MKPSAKPRVLFVCVENSCRSQIAEGFAKKWGADIIEAWSAGSKPSGKVNPIAVEVMKEIGVDLSRYTSKGLADLAEARWDYVITMGCGDACPIVPSKKKEDWAIPDPKRLPLDQFRSIRNLIEQRVRVLIEEVQ